MKAKSFHGVRSYTVKTSSFKLLGAKAKSGVVITQGFRPSRAAEGPQVFDLRNLKPSKPLTDDEIRARQKAGRVAEIDE